MFACFVTFFQCTSASETKKQKKTASEESWLREKNKINVYKELTKKKFIHPIQIFDRKKNNKIKFQVIVIMYKLLELVSILYIVYFVFKKDAQKKKNNKCYYFRVVQGVKNPLRPPLQLEVQIISQSILYQIKAHEKLDL